MITPENFQSMLSFFNMMEENKTKLPSPTNINENNSDLITVLVDIRSLLEQIGLDIEISTKDILNHPQGARFLNVSESELYQKVSRKEIIPTKPGKFNYYKKEDLKRYKLQRTQK